MLRPIPLAAAIALAFTMTTTTTPLAGDEPTPPAPPLLLASVEPVPEPGCTKPAQPAPEPAAATPPPPAPPPSFGGFRFHDAAQSRWTTQGLALGPLLANLTIPSTTVNACAAAKGLPINTSACVEHGAWNACSLNAGCESLLVTYAAQLPPVGTVEVRWFVTNPSGQTYAVTPYTIQHGGGILQVATWLGAHPVELWGTGAHVFRVALHQDGAVVHAAEATVPVTQALP